MFGEASKYSEDYMNTHPELKMKVLHGIQEGLVFPFGESELDIINSLSNVVIYEDVLDLYRRGINLSRCSEFSKLLSYAFDSPKIIIGYFDPSIRVKDKGHAWLEVGEYIYDTTLLLKIDKEYAKSLGYVKEKEYDPMLDSTYRMRKNRYIEKIRSKER